MELEERAARILLAIHQSMNWSIWGSKRLKYWMIYTDNVRSAAYTNSLVKFVNNLCSRMDIAVLGRNRAHRAQIEELLNGISPDDEKRLLRLFREEATTLVLQVRVWIEEKRAEYEITEEEETDGLPV